MTLWGGRFRNQLDPQAWELNASIAFDRRLARQEVRGSLAWANALEGVDLLSAEECDQICAGLRLVDQEFESGTFVYQPSDEDIHTAVERRLGELIGPLAGKLHTGRSRNDQVATDLRLWLLEHLPQVDAAVRDLQTALLGRAESDFDVLMPGYTHLQRAQPILLSHWWLSYFWPLQRDRQRLAAVIERADSLPLGAGALAGAPFPVDRAALAEALGFSRVFLNSIDAVSDRDFVAEFLFWAALTGVHLSRLSEVVILFSAAEFGFFELDDAYATGSSLMPHKKNPDVFELARGKTGSLLGSLSGWLTTLKGLPSAYDKDLQEDKTPVFNAYDTLTALLPVLSRALQTVKIYPEKMRAGIDASLLATDLAEYLVAKSLPFRQAHNLVGQAVQLAAETGKTLDSLSLEQYQSLHPTFGPDLYAVFDPAKSIARRTATGGTAPQAVHGQIQLAHSALNRP